MNTKNEMLVAALAYAERGWRVHPLKGKKPRLGDWPNRATTDAEQITEWWSKWPNANIGVLTGDYS